MVTLDSKTRTGPYVQQAYEESQRRKTLGSRSQSGLLLELKDVGLTTRTPMGLACAVSSCT